MKKPILILSTLLLAALVWGFLTPNGIRAAIANNAWSLAFIRQYFNPTSAQPALPAPPKTHPYAALLLARQALRNANPDLAESCLLPLVQKADPLALNIYAETQYTQGHYPQAIAAWQTLGNANTLEKIAADLSAKGLPDSELLAYQALYAINPEKYTANLAGTLKNNAQSKQALDLLDTSLETFPHSTWISTWLRYKGDIMLQQQNYSEAEAFYLQSVAQDPNEVKAWRNLGFMYLGATFEPLKAINCFEKLTQVAPQESYYYLLLAQAYEQSAQPAKALATYQALLALDPTNKEAQQAIDRLSPPD